MVFRIRMILQYIEMSGSDQHYDTIVIGLGAMGSSALYHQARRGRKVLGLEQFDIPHEKGSYHGITRIIRLVSCHRNV